MKNSTTTQHYDQITVPAWMSLNTIHAVQLNLLLKCSYCVLLDNF